MVRIQVPQLIPAFAGLIYEQASQDVGACFYYPCHAALSGMAPRPERSATQKKERHEVEADG